MPMFRSSSLPPAQPRLEPQTLRIARTGDVSPGSSLGGAGPEGSRPRSHWRFLRTSSRRHRAGGLLGPAGQSGSCWPCRQALLGPTASSHGHWRAWGCLCPAKQDSRGAGSREQRQSRDFSTASFTLFFHKAVRRLLHEPQYFWESQDPSRWDWGRSQTLQWGKIKEQVVQKQTRAPVAEAGCECHSRAAQSRGEGGLVVGENNPELQSDLTSVRSDLRVYRPAL